MVGFNLAARIRELEAEIKHLRKTIDSPLEEESWKADYGLLHALETSGLVCVARKWHAAYRKAQNSNLLRKQENEGLRADAEQYERVIEARLNVIDQQAAKIRELEADALQKSILCDSIAESKARAWQITEERKAAIKTLLVEMNDVPTSIHDIDLVIHAENVLRAMLKGAK
jgi:hypothetical protein